jgi:hypothetical protein
MRSIGSVDARSYILRGHSRFGDKDNYRGDGTPEEEGRKEKSSMD